LAITFIIFTVLLALALGVLTYFYLKLRRISSGFSSLKESNELKDI